MMESGHVHQSFIYQKVIFFLLFHKMNKALKENGIIYTSFKYGEFEGGEKWAFIFTDFYRRFIERILSLQIPQLQIKEIWTTGDVREGRGDERWFEYPDLQGKNILEIEPKYYNNLNIDGFSKMMKSPSYCYKIFTGWKRSYSLIFWGGFNAKKVKWLQNNKSRSSRSGI